MTRDDVSEGPLAKTDLKFGLVEKFDKRRNLDNGGTLWYTMQLFCHKGNPQSPRPASGPSPPTSCPTPPAKA